MTVLDPDRAWVFDRAQSASKSRNTPFHQWPLKGQAVLEFLRGNRTKEGEKVGQFRVRASPLGDIVDSSPVYIGAPGAPYLDVSDPGYSGFKSTFAARAPRLYVGANDGMLHALDEATGNETWAYVPTPLFRGGSATALPPVPNDPRTGLGALAPVSDVDTEAIGALTALGYSVVEAQAAVQSIPKGQGKDVEDRIRLALQYFSTP